MIQPELFEGTLFEANYLRRTYRQLTSNPLVALTELVANSWDAGATEVRIEIPDQTGKIISVSDNGIGLSEEEFRSRWLRLGYNRLEHQSSRVVFPDGRERGRLAFGRNGIGRHALMCFADEYYLETQQAGIKLSMSITSTVQNPVCCKDYKSEKVDANEHGLKLSAVVNQNLPNANQVLETLAKRFVADPEFTVYVNNRRLETTELLGESTQIKISDEISIEVLPLDVESSKKCAYQGIAFWQQNRLVGEPSWMLGDRSVVDARTAIARRYVFIVRSNDLADYVLPDWTGFMAVDVISKVHEKVEEFVVQYLEQRGMESLPIIQDEVRKQMRKDGIEVSRSTALEVDEAIKAAVAKKPTISRETVNFVAETAVHLAQMRSGKDLLFKLQKLSEHDVDELNRVLDNWCVRDVCRVLDEIDRRIAVIDAIRKLSSDKSIDELHVLHPLITEARWVFGPEFESAEFTANRQLQTVVKQLFNLDDAYFNNPKKRPDLVVKGDKSSTFSLTGIEDFSSEISFVRKILLIELKRGGFHITREERNQAQGYVEDLARTSAVGAETEIVAFVVGASIDCSVSRECKVDNRHRLIIITFDQIVDTAEKRLFGLRKILSSRYDDKSGMDLFNQVINQPTE